MIGACPQQHGRQREDQLLPLPVRRQRELRLHQQLLREHRHDDLRRAPSTPRGCSAVWKSYGVSDCTDGTSNTIAFAEALTGRNISGSATGQINTASGDAYRGDMATGAANPGTGVHGADDPKGIPGRAPSSSRPRRTQHRDAAAPGMRRGVGQADRRVLTSAGFSWADAPAVDLPRSSRPPTDPAFPAAAAGSAAPNLRRRRPSPTLSSNHPGGANVLMGDGSVRFIKSSVATDLVGPRHAQGGEVISADSY